MADPKAKASVQKKFDIAEDIKESKVTISVSQVEEIDGKIKASFEVSGLPTKPNSNQSEWQTIPKIFNDFDEFSAYGKEFFSKSDDEIVSLCKETK